MSDTVFGFYAVLPAPVRYDKDLHSNAKLLFAEITALSNVKGYCFASNKYFAELFNVDVRSVQRWLTSLAKKQYISVEVLYKENSKVVLSRRITALPPMTNLSPPRDKNVVENNINIISKRENIKREKNKPMLEHTYSPEDWQAVYTPIEDLDF